MHLVIFCEWLFQILFSQQERNERKRSQQYNSMSSICLALIKSSWLTREFVCLSYRRTLTSVWMVCFVVENRDIVKQNVSILGSCHHHNSWIVTAITENMSLQYQILLFRGKKQSLAFFDLGFLCWISFADHTDVKHGSLALCSDTTKPVYMQNKSNCWEEGKHNKRDVCDLACTPVSQIHYINLFQHAKQEKKDCGL